MQVKVEPENQLILDLISQLKVERAKDTQVLLVSFRHNDPEYAKNFLTTVLKLYLKVSSSSVEHPNSYSFFRNQQNTSLDELNTARTTFSEFRRKWNIYALDSQKNSAADGLSLINAQLRDTTLEIDTVTGMIAMIEKISPDDIESHLNNDMRNDQTILELHRNLVLIKSRYNKQLINLGSRHPDVLSLSEQMRKMQSDIYSEVLGTLKTRLATLMIEEESLLKKQQELRDLAQLLDEKGLEMQGLEQQLTILEKQYEKLFRQKRAFTRQH